MTKRRIRNTLFDVCNVVQLYKLGHILVASKKVHGGGFCG